MAQACIGLAKAHEARVIHRDIKPANIFLVQQEEGEILVKLLDFGIAKIKADGAQGADTTSLTRSGGLLGSPLYMSPEQARGIKEIDYRTDIWSLGVVLYHALCGRAPHADIEALGALIITLCAEAPPSVQSVAPWIPPEVAAVVHGALQIDPSHRYPSAAAMLDAIKPLLPSGLGLRKSELVPRVVMQRVIVAPAAGGGDQTVLAEAAIKDCLIGVTVINDRLIETMDDDAMPPSQMPLPPRPRVRTTFALGTALALGIGVLGLYRVTNPAALPEGAGTTAEMLGPRREYLGALEHSVPESTQSSDPPQRVRMEVPPSAALRPADTLPRFTLMVIPTDASVEIDGAAVPVHNGSVEISGEFGSVHRIRVSKGISQQTGSVMLTAAGAVPPEIEIGGIRVINEPPQKGPKWSNPPSRGDRGNPISGGHSVF